MIICIDCRMLLHSGIGVYIKHIVNGLLQNGQPLTLLGNKGIINKCITKSNNCKVISFNSSIYSISEQLKYPFVIPSCDIFISPHYNIPLFPVKAKNFIVTIHDMYHIDYQHLLSLKQRIYVNILMRAAIILSKNIITVSYFSKQQIIRFTNKNVEDRVNVIYNGIDQKIFHTKVTIEKKENYILFVGNVKPHKNLLNSLKAFKLLLKQFPTVKFYVVGKKDGFINGGVEHLAEIIDELNNKVTFTGWVDDAELVNYYRNALLLIFPSFYEGFGLPPLEAMSCGCPVIASNLSSIPEVCGSAAYYFNPYDYYNIAEALAEVISNDKLRQTLVEAGYERVQEFSWQKSVEKHFEIIQSIAQKLS